MKGCKMEVRILNEVDRNKLIGFYEDRLTKVIKQFGNSPLHKAYVRAARKNLRLVKNGRNW